MEQIGLVSFLLFAGLSFLITADRQKILKRNLSDWITDVASLLVHFIAIPALQVLIVYRILNFAAPQLKGALPADFLTSLLLYILLDYLWYWNHRILHAQTPLWNLHKTHHSPSSVDVFITPRNALITHFFMIYFWFIGIATYLLSDPTAFLGLATFGLVINFWGHTSLSLPCNSLINRVVSAVIITPREHHWHHSRSNPNCNFGTVFSFWDKLHKTAHCEAAHPKAYGDDSKKPFGTN